MSESDLERIAQIAHDLATATKGLDRYIDAEANKRAAERGKIYAKAADERIRDNAAELQRAQDLVAELRRQMKPLTRDAYYYAALKRRVLELANLAEGAGDAVAAKLLRTAINEAQAAGRARWEQEQADAKQRELAGG
jgi:hypothetical protein